MNLEIEISSPKNIFVKIRFSISKKTLMKLVFLIFLI
ncbi:Uncharacterised protein [Legionella moravica]|uniref:Uncharacterized protein n=1 Tax=Legionella moravica TaxID=39962 RepID=A0A378JVJ7_9GAMM|nr:Uncharacterised protein [Legionella moravica]